MTQEDKELLLKDLCGRLPYGVKVRYSSYEKFITCTLQALNPVYNIVDLWSKEACFKSVNINKIKPYLFPMSSMTEEHKKEYNYWKHEVPVCYYEYGDVVEKIELLDSPESFEYLIENHFDYRGLIEKGLAIDATGLNIY